MNAPPEANTEYSRGSGASRRGSGASRRPITSRRGAADAASAARAEAPRTAAAIALVALLGSLLILLSQFTTLYYVRSATSSVVIKSVGTGANHAWAPIPLALAAVALAFAAWRYGNRAALAGLLVLGIATLLIVLLGDLPGARATGLIGSSAGGYVQATATPSAGLYMETLGAVLLLIAGGLGLLMLGARPAPARATPQASSEKATPHAAPMPGEPPAPKDALISPAPEGRRWSAS